MQNLKQQRKFYSQDFSKAMYVYYIKPDGTTGCSTDVKNFDKVKENYKDCIIIVAPENAPIYFRRI